MHQQHDRQILADPLELARVQRGDRKQLLQLAEHRPCRLADNRVATHRQRTDQADTRLLRLVELVHQFGDVVLEESLARRIEERHRERLAVDAVHGIAIGRQRGADQAEEHALAVAAAAERGQAVALGARFVVGVRHRVHDLQVQFAGRARHHFLQHLAHPLLVAAQLRQVARRVFGEIQRQPQRPLQVPDDLHRAGRQRVQPVRGEIDPRHVHPAAQRQRGGDEHEHQRGQSGRQARASTDRPAAHAQRLRRRSSNSTPAVNQATMLSTK